MKKTGILLLLPLLGGVVWAAGAKVAPTKAAAPVAPVAAPPVTLAGLPPAAPVAAGGAPLVTADWRTTLLAAWRTPPPTGNVEPTANGVRLVTVTQPEHLYTLQTQLRNILPLHTGDTILVRFAARSLMADKSTGVTHLKVGFGKASPPWDASYQGEIGLGADWQRFDIPFTCKNDFAPNEAQFVLSFGYPAQVAEVAEVQVLRFGPEVLPASLPRTKHYADPVSPNTLAREVARIARLRREYDAPRDPAPAHGRALYVAAGRTGGDGTAQKPFATIPQALKTVQPGDTILVGAGDYHEPQGIAIRTSGRPDAWIKIQAAPGTRPRLLTSNWSGFELRGGIAYIEIKGFELSFVPDPAIKAHGVGIAPMYASHHIRILNNVVHGYGTGGICSLDCDYLLVEGNTIYNTAKTSPYGGSAISLCRAFNFDDAPGYHNVVRRNICYDNELLVSVLETSGGNGRALTDGNGIIIDVFKRSRANPLKPHGEDRDGPLLPYRGRTLVENNLIYNNGGRGIHVFRSAKVDVVNNTCYMNQKSADINAGELTAIEADNVTLLNNIAYGRKEKRGNTQDGSTGVIWSNNLFFNADDVLLHDGIITGRDPGFVAPSLTAPPDGFRLRPSSPARGKGLVRVAPDDDLTGRPRPPKGPIDLGAYQTAPPAPVASRGK